ncbi:C40 family peptidase [Flaviaesturariibacter terrae]
MRIPVLSIALLLAACGGPAFDPRYSEGIEADTLLRTDSAAAFRDSMPADGTRSVDTTLAATPPHAAADTNIDLTALPAGATIQTKGVRPEELLAFAQTLIGTRYVYGSTNPSVGFDCSGFITYVFNHFHISVPRSSVDFTRVGQTVDTLQARPGDLILFTGTNPLEREVGHMGIVIDRSKTGLRFIHSSSGKAMGVTITPLNDYYKGRFVRVARIFP